MCFLNSTDSINMQNKVNPGNVSIENWKHSDNLKSDPQNSVRFYDIVTKSYLGPTKKLSEQNGLLYDGCSIATITGLI